MLHFEDNVCLIIGVFYFEYNCIPVASCQKDTVTKIIDIFLFTPHVRHLFCGLNASTKDN